MEILLVRLSQKTLQTQKHALDIQDRTPFILEDIQADTTAEVDVGVVDGTLEHDVGRCIRVVRGEGEGKFECEALVRCVIGPVESGGPHEKGIAGWKGGDARRGGRHERHEFGLESTSKTQSQSMQIVSRYMSS
jgi:hypothetical protein